MGIIFYGNFYHKKPKKEKNAQKMQKTAESSDENPYDAVFTGPTGFL